MGEIVLRRIGIRISLLLQRPAFLARWEGGEFIALFPDTSATEAGALLDGVLLAVRQVRFQPASGPEFSITFSAGVTEVLADATLEDALAGADRLRYRAKTAGRSLVLTREDQTSAPRQRILFAEDDESVARLMRVHLTTEGFDVVHYRDGASALAAAPESGAALVLTDVEMPGLNGLQLLQGLRRLPGFHHVPVMMLTGMGDESYIVRAFELGADDYVLKPFSAREVVARIRRLLGRHSVASVAEEAAPFSPS